MATKVKVKNVEVLLNSIKKETVDGVVTLRFQANGYIYIEGNPYVGNPDCPLNDPIKPEMVTMKTFFDLTCSGAEVENMDSIAAVKAQEWLDVNYPEIQ